MGVKLRERKLKNGRKRYYLDIYHNGVRSYEWLHAVEKNDDKKQKKQLAETIRAARSLELESEGTNFIPKHKKKVTVSKYFDHYLQNYKQRDIRSIRNAINKFQEFLQRPNFTLSNLSQIHLEKFKYYLVHEAGLKGETPYSYWKRFKKVLINAEREGYIKDTVYKRVRWESSNKKAETTLTKQILTEDEIQALKSTYCGNENVKRAFLFACYTGLGYAEFKSLTWKNIVNDRLVIDRIKTRREINIKLSPFAQELLGEPGNGLIFDLKHKGKFLSEVAIKKNLTNMMRRAGIDKNITFYCGRHTFAVRLLSNGANLKTVADALGHSGTAHTIKYLNYVNSIKDDATSSLD
ncbi:site-specific integrase [Robiginitalea sp. SC105]|uniref:site-specific integrase n=1 Tax=Robiginitalea sp. SC105 TaxID=2762332 RepID=UPI00163A67CA|nr:site-specific integrase [Robiginitalea sp. SC105]MBC2838861.1 site-specific integrase [Robiginitalea sp. SC105]